MAGTLAELKVEIDVKTAKLKSGLKTSEGLISKHSRKIGMGMTALGGIIAAVGVMSIKAYSKMGDEVQKMALRTGFSTEALSELRHAADLSGASLAGIEKASRTLSGAILDAGYGLETYVRAFDKIGLSYEDLKDLSPEQQFLAVMEALAGVEDESVRAAIATDILGRAGTQLLPMLSQGAEGLREMRQEAHTLGIVFDQEAADKAAKFNDANTRLSESLMGIKMMIADKLIPAITPLVDKITAVITQIKDWMDANPQLSKLIMIVVGAIGGLLLVFGPLLIFLPGIIAALPLLGAAFSLLLGPVGLIILAIAALIAIGILVYKNWDVIKEKAREIWNGIAKFFKSVWQWITNIFREHWDIILAILFPAIGLPILIARNWGEITEKIQAIWDKVTGIIRDWWQNIKEFFAKLNPWEWIKEGWNKITEGIQNILKSIFGSSLIEDWFNNLKSWLLKLNPWEWMKEGWQGIVDGVRGILRSIFGGSLMEEWVGDLKSWLSVQSFDSETHRAFGTMLTAAEEELNKTSNLTKDRFDDIADYLRDLVLPYPEIEPPPVIPPPVPPPPAPPPEPEPPPEEEPEETPAPGGLFPGPGGRDEWDYADALADAVSSGRPITLSTRQIEKGMEIKRYRFSAKKYGWYDQIKAGELIQDYYGNYLREFRRGGIITRPTIGLLGEAGPEAVIPLGKGGLGETHYHFEGNIFMGNEAEARKFAKLITKYQREEQRGLYGTPSF